MRFHIKWALTQHFTIVLSELGRNEVAANSSEVLLCLAERGFFQTCFVIHLPERMKAVSSFIVFIDSDMAYLDRTHWCGFVNG